MNAEPPLPTHPDKQVAELVILASEISLLLQTIIDEPRRKDRSEIHQRIDRLRARRDRLVEAVGLKK